MPLKIERESLGALSRGFSLFGSGGGGSPHLIQLLLEQDRQWPLEVASIDELDPGTPCFAPAVAGATMLFGERLPARNAFDPLLDAAEHWLGMHIPVVCCAEGGGMNGLTPLLFASERTVVDADCTGRAVPSLDQFSLFVDEIPGLLVVCDTGAGGMMLMQSDRPSDIEKMVRAAMIQAGGVGNVILAGFTVGDLRSHAIPGHLARALRLGERWISSQPRTPESTAEALGARLLGTGRITAVVQDSNDEHVHTAQISGTHGEVFRLVGRSEFLAFLVDGRVVASAPECLIAIDPLTQEILESTSLSVNRLLEVYALPVDDWWYRSEHRLRRVIPSEYRLQGLDHVQQPGRYDGSTDGN